jgi:hydroxyacylglutathione hydrolase
MALQIEQFMCRSDNFGVLVHDPEAGVTAAIDAPEFGPITDHLARRGWNLTDIFVTHHHGDHVEAILPLKQAFQCRVTGPAAEADRIPGIDRQVRGGDRFAFGGTEVEVLDTPGHTLGHISYFIPKAKVAFTADTLFSLGCGRVFEGTPAMMWESLGKIMALPDDTSVHVGHEYTQANARFALTIEPDNADLVARAREVDALRAAGRPTLPTTIGQERRTNPFVRADVAGIARNLGMEGAPAAEVFAEIRKRKDHFK